MTLLKILCMIWALIVLILAIFASIFMIFIIAMIPGYFIDTKLRWVVRRNYRVLYAYHDWRNIWKADKVGNVDKFVYATPSILWVYVVREWLVFKDTMRFWKKLKYSLRWKVIKGLYKFYFKSFKI